ncbi:MAG TPA: flagellar biosynthetic protein FliO [Polyangia bacterium]|jgi:flagellar biogenesis protein FliO
MIPSLLLLSASVVASPVFISEVRATREPGHLRVEVRADGGIDPEAARTKIDEGRLFLFLGGAHVKADNRAWPLKDGNGEIRAHRHHTETELDVPLTGNGCSGPVELQGTPTGMTALVGCEGSASAIPQSAPAPVVVAKAKPEKVAVAEETALHKLVALPPSEDDSAEEEAKAPADAETKAKVGAKTNKEEPAKTPVVVTAPPVAAPITIEQPASHPLAADALAATASDAKGKTTTTPSGLRAVGLPALLLAGLALAAYLFARKKRGLGTRRIEILETASLGPKRSLVIARVGDDTLVLGSSEAGITLLRSSGDQATAALGMPAKVATVVETLKANSPTSELDQPLVEALADVPQPDDLSGETKTGRAPFRAIEGGLASLFGRGAVATPPRVEPTFDDFLEDSVEDQELRRKLAAGMSARVR